MLLDIAFDGNTPIAELPEGFDYRTLCMHADFIANPVAGELLALLLDAVCRSGGGSAFTLPQLGNAIADAVQKYKKDNDEGKRPSEIVKKYGTDAVRAGFTLLCDRRLIEQQGMNLKLTPTAFRYLAFKPQRRRTVTEMTGTS